MPASIPVVALAFVYHNIVPVVTSSLEGDLRRVRTALVTGTSLPSAPGLPRPLLGLGLGLRLGLWIQRTTYFARVRVRVYRLTDTPTMSV